MDLRLREGRPEDARVCGTIAYEAFKSIADRHNFPPDFATVENAVAVVSFLLANSGFHKVAAEVDGRIVGSNFLDERNPIAGVGPITVEPAVQDRAIGRRLMQAVMERATARNFPGVRLVQAAYHRRSLSLYTKLGFDSREPLSVFQGTALSLSISGCAVRPARESDLDECSRLCIRVHGHDRTGEMRDALRIGYAAVVERAGRITGYTSAIAFFGHAVSETNDDLKALIGAAQSFGGPGFLVPTRNGDLMRWCLNHGLRIVYPATLMTLGLYNEPAGAYLPSVIY
ncbi:MAG TPA: GNAT family N-acetyltransferase [Candidatus Binataceae bacterium]|nr:GNAT family N-acetyltransferase [Candidatus Binataceae bacterium]